MMIPKAMRCGTDVRRDGFLHATEKMFVAYEAVLDMKVTFITMPLPGTEH
jgi:hypothetical protein